MKGAGSTFVSNLSCDVSDVIAAIVIMKTWGAANQTHGKQVRPNGVHHRVYCGTLSQRCTSILRTTCSSVLCQFCCTILYLCGSVGHISCLWKSTVPVYSQLSLSNATLTSAHHENQLQDWCHINTDRQSVYRPRNGSTELLPSLWQQSRHCWPNRP